MRADQKIKARRGEGGFTLIEVIIAIAILSIGLLGVASMQTASIRGNHLGYRYTEGTTLAQDRLEWLFTRPYTDASLSAGTNKADPVGGAPANYTITYDVADVGGINAKLITVRVNLQEKGASRATTLQCLRPQII